MTHSFVHNGETQLVLVPSNEAERLLLRMLLDNEVEVSFVQDQLSLLGKPVSGGIIIRKKPKTQEVQDRSGLLIPVLNNEPA